MSVPLYWRQFTRDGKPDVDTQADAAFLAANFTDYFGQWLQVGTNGSTRSFEDLIMPYWTGSQQSPAQYKVSTFMIADGSFIQADEKPDWSWFNPHIRLVTLVCQAGKTFFASSPSQWTLCIVGSRLLSNQDRNESFLQVASWNGSEFRFYQNDLVNGTGSESFWNYFGKSMDAFGVSEYLGPFNGHVNGCCIMKELHKPWLHWFSSSGSFQSCFSSDDVATFMKAPYITAPGQGLLSSVNANPGELEIAVRSGISNWFSKRLKNDFIDTTKSPSQPLPSPTHIPRWTAHMFLTTTINIGAAVSTGTPGVYGLPYDHFYDNELLQNFDLIPSDIQMDATFNQTDCIAAANNLGLSLIQELDPDKQPPTTPDFTLSWQSLGGDRRSPPDYPNVGYKIALAGEGLSPFNFLQSSYEDAQGVIKSQHIMKVGEKQGQPSFTGLFSTHTFYAIMMVDFWNPIYSWKRGILMGYVPQTTNFDGNSKSYDLEQNFIANVQKSPKASEPASPEYQFLQLLNKTLEDFQQMIRDYLGAVANRIRTDPVPALQDYLSLAESRRRIYRPLPLDEFGYTLPFATKIHFTPGKGLLEMTPQGTVEVMDQRGQDFLNAWTTSLAEPDPHVVPAPEANSQSSELAAASLVASALPKPATLAIRCQSLTSPASSPSSISSAFSASRRFRREGGGCPFKSQRVAEAPSESFAPPDSTGATGVPVGTASSLQSPNWTDDILPMLTAPYWVSGDPKETGTIWRDAMLQYGGKWDLFDYGDVSSRTDTIYEHVFTKAMPVTENYQDYWPDEALKKFKAWADAGCPKDSTSRVISAKEAIPSPGAEATTPDLMVRRDIMSLTKEELAVYQSKLDDVLQSQSLESKWQELGILHAEWCLHYQEATFFWHRAHLRYMEKLIGHPIPYWNGFATAAADPTSPYAGIPPVFLEETYVHPVDGTTRKNPLKYSLALNGKSKDGTSRYPVRRPALVEGRSSPEWAGQIGYFNKYHQQIIASLQTSMYSSPGQTSEGFGLPWANILTFSEDQPDSLYPYRTDFDGLFEQVHDNFHGWVGPDMADNTYTAFDPIFYSYHANMDRLLGIYLDSHAGSLHFTADFPLQPFILGGPLGQVTINYNEPRRWAFATIGNMAGRSAALGYVYAPPASPDAWAPAVSPALTAYRDSVQPSGGKALTLWRDVVSAARSNTGQETAAKKNLVPYVLFRGVGCTDESYIIEVFGPGQGEVPGKDSTTMTTQHEDHIGQVTRLGMGPGVGDKGRRNNARRCRKPEATRMLKVDDLRIAANLEKDPKVRLVVTRLQDGQVLGKEEYKGLSGFEPQVVWLPAE